jgi:hypothetical protein
LLVKVLLMSVLIFLIPFPAQALEIEPLRLELSLPAGEESEGVFVVTNEKDHLVDLTISADAYRYLFSDMTIYPKEKSKHVLPSCTSWFRFTP